MIAEGGQHRADHRPHLGNDLGNILEDSHDYGIFLPKYLGKHLKMLFPILQCGDHLLADKGHHRLQRFPEQLDALHQGCNCCRHQLQTGCKSIRKGRCQNFQNPGNEGRQNLIPKEA